MMISISLPMHVIDREEEKCRKRYCQKKLYRDYHKSLFSTLQGTQDPSPT
jgi:hypothetical protein